MAWSDVKPYFKTILEAKLHVEHPDGFNIENLPSTLMDKAYHVLIGPISGDRQNQSDQESTVTVTIKTFYKGFRYPQEAQDIAILETEEIMKSCVNLTTRTTTSGILNVVFDNSEIDPVGETNDNAVVVTSTYSCRVIIDVC